MNDKVDEAAERLNRHYPYLPSLEDLPGFVAAAYKLRDAYAEQKRVLEWLENKFKRIGDWYVTPQAGRFFAQGPTLTDAVLEAIKRSPDERNNTQ